MDGGEGGRNRARLDGPAIVQTKKYDRCKRGRGTTVPTRGAGHFQSRPIVPRHYAE